jgi:uncharacterized protein with beta-barrel porin domain
VSSVGLRVHKIYQMERGLRFVPELWAGWGHEFGDRDRPLDARLTGVAYRVVGASAARDGAQYGIGWHLSRANDLSFLLYYDGGWNQDLLTHGLTAGVLLRW